MSRFLISHPDGREYELTDLDYFRRAYQPQGFAIVVKPPHGYDVPETALPKKAAPVAVKADDKPPKKDA